MRHDSRAMDERAHVHGQIHESGVHEGGHEGVGAVLPFGVLLVRHHPSQSGKIPQLNHCLCPSSGNKESTGLIMGINI